MRSEVTIRDEPGEYRMVARYGGNGVFTVLGESVHPITLTVRVEDVWNRIPTEDRRMSYSVAARRDGSSEPFARLDNVAPDARIFLDFEKTFEMDFT